MRELAVNGIEVEALAILLSFHGQDSLSSAVESDSHTLLVPVATGELIDKITILRLKAQRLKRPEALANVKHELQALEAVLNEAGTSMNMNAAMMHIDALQAVNTELWNVEDALRQLEAEQRFDQMFIELARSVYQLNDQRAALKRQINEACGSTLLEEKSYGEQ